MTKHTILFLAANPHGTDPRALDREARAIQVELERSGHRDRFELVTRWAVEPLDLLRELRKLRPTVVHFSGRGGHVVQTGHHTNGTPRRDVVGEDRRDREETRDSLYFQGPDGQARRVSPEALQKTFGAAGSSVQVVVLDACYSATQARALLAHVDCVVSVRGMIRDDAARSFAIGFYGGLGEHESIATAYEQGCAAISLEGLPDADRPQLVVRDGVDAEQLVLAADALASPPEAGADRSPAGADLDEAGPPDAGTRESSRGAASRAKAPSRGRPGAPLPDSSHRQSSVEPRAATAAISTPDAEVRRDPEDMELLVMKNPDVPEGAEFPATVVFVVIKGLKDCSDAPQIPNALRALNDSLRDVDAGAFVLSTIAGVIVVVPDRVAWSADDIIKALDEAKVGLALKVGVTHGTVEAVRDIDDETNLIGPPINIAARLATSSDNPGLLVHESYAEFVDATLSASHWLHRSVRKAIPIVGKPQDPKFICFQGPHAFQAKLPAAQEPYSSPPAVLVAYDLPKFSVGDRAQLRQRFTRLVHVFKKLRQSSPLQAATALLSPGGDGGVLVLKGVNLPDAAAIASRLRSLTEIESLDHADAIAVETRIGVHYGPVAHYVNARGISRPTGLAVFVVDEIAGDHHARSRNGIIFTRLLADSISAGSSQRLASEFEVLPRLTSGPASGVDRFVQRFPGPP